MPTPNPMSRRLQRRLLGPRARATRAERARRAGRRGARKPRAGSSSGPEIVEERQA